MATSFLRNTLGAGCLGLSLVCAAPAALAVGDVLETPSMPSKLAPKSLLNDVAVRGDRIVAAGERGHIVVSDDQGQSWTQASVPVSVTLTGVDFGTDSELWAVGHSGAVLHSSDAGKTWSLQLDGVKAAKLAISALEDEIAALEQRIDTAPEAQKSDLEYQLDDLNFTLENMQSDLDIGPVNPFLDVWFENAEHGIVVGAYGLFFQTWDGGNTWKNWAPKLDNGQGYHLNAVSQVSGGALVIVGEAGQIFVSVDNGQTWEKRDSPYPGSLFGVTGTGRVNEILAFGLRGTLLYSTDIGKTWTTRDTGSTETLNDGAVDGNRIVLVGNGGAILTSENDGGSFKETLRPDREGLMGVVPLPEGRLLLVGERGAVRTDAAGKDLQ